MFMSGGEQVRKLTFNLCAVNKVPGPLNDIDANPSSWPKMDARPPPSEWPVTMI